MIVKSYNSYITKVAHDTDKVYKIMKYKIGVFMLCILSLLFCQGCCDDDAINVNERIQSNAGGIFCIENVRSKELTYIIHRGFLISDL